MTKNCLLSRFVWLLSSVFLLFWLFVGLFFLDLAPVVLVFRVFLAPFFGVLDIKYHLWPLFSAEGATPEASDRRAVRFEIAIARDRRLLRR